MAEENNIGYEGPNEEYKPTIGSSIERRTQPPNISNLGYHDLPQLKRLLDAIISETTSMINLAESVMVNYNLLTSSDDKLGQAQPIEWPSELGEPKHYVTYDQFKALGNIDSRVSSYIRKTYIDKIRGVSGTNSIDIINVSNAIQQEALHIKDFIDDAVGAVSDTAEFRAIELLQDWANAALRDTRMIRDFFEKGAQSLQQIPEAELAEVSPEQARRYQAIFQVKLNLINQDIEKLNTDLTKQTGLLSEIFFKRFFGPALKMKLKVTNDLHGSAPVNTFLGQQAQNAVNGLTLDYVTALTDQMTRNNLYNTKVKDLKDRIAARDTYVNHIRQLAKKGTAVPTPFIKSEVTALEKTVWNNVVTAATPNNQFESSHSSLSGIDDPLAHPQYILKAGDMLTGDIETESGVKIDGVDVNEHTHSGLDGSARISGINILGGTLGDSAVDTSPPTTPTTLELKLFQSKIIPPGVFSIQATLSWDGDPNHTFEIQIVKDE